MINISWPIILVFVLSMGCTSMHRSHRQVPPSTHDSWRKKPILKGVVKKIIIEENVRFIKLATESEKSTWVTILNGSPRVGEAVQVHIDCVIDNFHSKLLNRQFKKLSFGALALNPS